VGVCLARARPQDGTVVRDDDSANFGNPLWVVVRIALRGHLDGRFHVRSVCHSLKHLIAAPIRRKPSDQPPISVGGGLPQFSRRVPFGAGREAHGAPSRTARTAVRIAYEAMGLAAYPPALTSGPARPS
jgi:hypothetical protein